VTGPSAAPTAPAYPVGVMSVPPGGGDMHLAMHTAASLQTLASNPATCELAADLIADVLSRGVDQTTVALTASIPPPAADSFPESHWWDRLQNATVDPTLAPVACLLRHVLTKILKPGESSGHRREMLTDTPFRVGFILSVLVYLRKKHHSDLQHIISTLQ
jgi:hypothetical protein